MGRTIDGDAEEPARSRDVVHVPTQRQMAPALQRGQRRDRAGHADPAVEVAEPLDEHLTDRSALLVQDYQ